ncbi:hypothetical protein HYALB_00004814 [Hymenoscyphus albidus]|uniref:Aquaporin-like protein n=1 Tax=Hymenoscyphus albidus TaxID=595503 RepID=A0A9N9Q0Y1_9HELO|nr:hypothetical protein HYALB_00004814 [Hymenoscyphus albidus]
MGDGDGEGQKPGGTFQEHVEDEQHLLSPNINPRDVAHDDLAPLSPLPSITEGAPLSTLQFIEEGQVLPLNRAGTMPVQPREAGPSASPSGSSQKNRGRSESTPQNPQNPQPRQLSPRSRIFGRTSINSNEAPTIHSSPERPERHVSIRNTARPRANTSTAYPQFNNPGMRPRMGTWATGARARNGTIRRRPTVRVQAPQDADQEENVDFSLAGPPVEVLTTNQPYVDPGYADLNPAYEQPANTRPVWGLAGPLPRVIRSGMIPAREELKVDVSAVDNGKYNQQQDLENEGDVEMGRMEPTRLGRLSSQIQGRRRSASRLIHGLGRSDSGYRRTDHSPVSPGVGENQPYSPQTQPIKEQDGGNPKLNDIPEIVGQTQNPEGDGWYPDDAASAKTEHEEAGNWEGEDYLGYGPEDEIHNLHTRWSEIRLKFREPLAELLAVTVQLTLGFSANLASTAAGNNAPTDLAWGLATMVGIYIAGGISGAHLNPAISIMLCIFRGFPLRKVPIYIAAQLLGAFLAALIAFSLYQRSILQLNPSLADSGTLSAFITYPRQTHITGALGFGTEFLSTSFLAIAVLAMGDDTNAPPGAGMSAFIIGLTITILSMAFSFNTGAAMNPARDLGPRLAVLALGYGKSVFENAYWVYGPGCGPLLGAVVGAFVYDVCIFVGGESPVNYPRKRILGVGSKWRRRVGGKLGRGREE